MSCIRISLRGLPAVALAVAVLLLGCAQCAKRDQPNDEGESTAEVFTVEKQADLSRLAVVAADMRYLLGIDTTTFYVVARIRWNGPLFDKLARLPDGGVLVVDERMEQESRLYRLNPDCSLYASVPVPDRPTTPFVHGNLAIMGGSYFGPEGIAVMVYQLDSMVHRKTFGVKGRVIRQEGFCAQGDKIFLPYVNSVGELAQRESFPVMLDANTLDSTHLHIGELLKGEGANSIIHAVCDNTLVVLPISGCHPIVYDLATRRTLAHRDVGPELIAKIGQRRGISGQPVVRNGMLHTLYIIAEGMVRKAYWVKIRISDLSLIDAKQVALDYGARWTAGDDFHTFGRFYIIEADMPGRKTFRATFVDWRTGEVAGQCEVYDLAYK